MKAISIRCPECGAKLSVSVDARESLCEYCGSKSQIQHRTGFFERVQPPSNRGSGGGPKLPVAVQQHSAKWIAALIGLPTLVVGLAVPIVATRRAEQRAAAAGEVVTTPRVEAETAVAIPKPPTLTWTSGGAALLDINGDGTLDLVGRILLSTRSQKDDKLAAFDGTNGESLWMSEELKLKSDDTAWPVRVSEDTLVFPQNDTSLRGFSVSDGVAGWTTGLPDKLGLVCRGPQEGTLALQTADKLWHTLTLSDGQLQPLAWEGPCRSVEGDSGYLSRPGQLYIDGSSEYPALALESVEGMTAKAGVFDMGSKIAIALAEKQPGTAVPMLARYEHQNIEARILEGDLGGMRSALAPEARKALDPKWSAAKKKVPKAKAKLLWTVAVPSGDPLKAKAGAPWPRNVALQDEVVVVAYESGPGGHSLAAFDVADGTRLWEVGLSGGTMLPRILASPTHVFAFQHSGVSAYGLQDGELAYSIP